MPSISLPTPGQKPWNLNPALTAINDMVDDHETAIQALPSTIVALAPTPAQAQLEKFREYLRGGSASSLVYIGLGDSTRDEAGPSPYYYTKLRDLTAVGLPLEGMSGSNIISLGRNGATLASMLADPTWLAGIISAIAGRPAILDLSVLTNDVRTAGLGTTVAAIGPAGAARLQSAINVFRAISTKPIIKLTVPAPYLDSGAYVTGVTPLIATQGVRYAYYLAAAANPDVILQDSQEEIFGFTTARPYDGDQLHPGAGAQRIVAQSVADFLGSRIPTDLGLVTAAYTAAPTSPWTSYAGVVNDPTKFTLVAQGNLAAYSVTATEYFRIQWPYALRGLYGQPGDVVVFPDGTAFAPTAWGSKTQNGAYVDTFVTGIPDTIASGLTGDVKVYRPLSIDNGGEMDTAYADTSAQFILTGRIHTGGTNFIRVTEKVLGDRTVGSMAPSTSWASMLTAGDKVYIQGYGSNPIVLTAPGAINQGWEAALTGSWSAYVGATVVIVGTHLVRGQAIANLITAAGAAQTIPAPATGSSMNTLVLTANCTLTFPASGDGQAFDLILEQGGSGSYTVTWPAGKIKWAAGTAPTLTTTVGKSDWLRFRFTRSWWLAEVVAQNL